MHKFDCICSYCTPNIHDMFAITNRNKFLYCIKHNIQFEKCVIEHYDKHSAWYKVEYILQLFEKYNNVFYIDADASFIKYDDISDFINFEKDVTLCETAEGLNTRRILYSKK